MDRIEWAERGYRQIVPNPNLNWDEVPTRKLDVWLKDAVAPLVAEFVHRPSFQELATWPLRELRQGSDTPARAAVNAVDESLVRCARTIRDALQSTRLQSALKKQMLPTPRVAKETIAIDGQGAKPISRTKELVDPFPVMLAQIESIAGRFWSDLVNPADYWQPSTRWLLKEGVQTLSSGELVASLNPEIHLVGAFVVRCLDRRVDILVKKLGSTAKEILTAARAMRSSAPKASTLIPPALQHVQACVRDLYKHCWPEPEGAFRDSCITLLQAYVGYHLNPEVEWLGEASAEWKNGKHWFRHAVSHARKLEVTERVATALADLRRIYANAPPGQSAFEEALASGGLVIVEASRQVHWSRTKLKVPWARHPMPWKLFIAMARKARHGGYVLERDLYESLPSLSAMATLHGRLKKLLPATLRKWIEPGPEPRSYQLKLSSKLIHFIDPLSHRSM